jgi:hypothetical protein
MWCSPMSCCILLEFTRGWKLSSVEIVKLLGPHDLRCLSSKPCLTLLARSPGYSGNEMTLDLQLEFSFKELRFTNEYPVWLVYHITPLH